MTPEELDELERRDKAATRGPWWIELSRDEKLPLLKYRWDDVPTWIAEASNRENNRNDFDFIAALRNAFPDLLSLARIGAAAVESRSSDPAHDLMNKLIDAYLAKQKGE